ncbi:hypothetical protein WJX84_009152 [Apatococcus fuscideae]|uniref:CW-type domain-containing protein n=1 Tax=Apatococcus fuscideae TaxID=2026836 RepID=A0AAW1SS50_9CHLO
MADRRSLTLLPFLAAGILQPGQGKLSCSVGGTEYYADLKSDGTIFFESEAFRSPSSFSVFVKRKLNPRRIADDGWTSVKYCGTVLREFKKRVPPVSGVALGSPAAASTVTSFGSQVPRNLSKRKRPPKRSRPAYELSETTAEQSSEVVSDADGFFENFRSGREPPGARGGRASSAGSQELCPASRPTLLQPQRPPAEQSPLTHQQSPASGRAEPWTFVQCDIKACQKWRRIITSDVPEGPWTCGMNNDPEHDTCSAPQQHTEAEMQMLIDEQRGEAHSAACQRPPLSECSEAQFYADLTAFLEARGETSSARTIRERRIQCNNMPLDTMGLYREVVARGGLAANERYDSYGRWTGTINFAGQIFPKMSNFTSNHRATSVGNQLLQNYRKFLAAYEDWHQHDVTPIQATASFEAGQDRLAFLAGIISDQEEGQSSKDEAKPAIHESGEGVSGTASQQQLLAERLHSVSLPERTTSTPAEQDPRAKAPPARLLGEMFGWVDPGICCPFDPGRLRARQVPCPTQGDSSAEAAAAHSLKIATQLHASRQREAAAQRLTEAAGIACVAASLLDLERRLPASALRIQAFAFWHGWRRSVTHAQSPHELAAQVLLLGQQLLPELLAASDGRSGRDALMDSLALAAQGGGSCASDPAGPPQLDHEGPTAGSSPTRMGPWTCTQPLLGTTQEGASTHQDVSTGKVAKSGRHLQVEAQLAHSQQGLQDPPSQQPQGQAGWHGLVARPNCTALFITVRLQ